VVGGLIRFITLMGVIMIATILLVGHVQPQEIATMGGSGWRVTDAVEYTMEQRDILLFGHLESVQKCVGIVRPLGTLRLFSVGVIVFKGRDDRWHNASGYWMSGERTTLGEQRIYFVRGTLPAYTEELLRHELIHYLTQLAHPDVDEIINRCENPARYNAGQMLDNMILEMIGNPSPELQ